MSSEMSKKVSLEGCVNSGRSVERRIVNVGYSEKISVDRMFVPLFVSQRGYKIFLGTMLFKGSGMLYIGRMNFEARDPRAKNMTFNLVNL